MRIYTCEDYAAMSRRAADILAAQIILKPDCVLGLATGSTPVGAYAQLAAWHREGVLSFAQVRSVNLDEYRGLSGGHPQSYRHFMQKHLFRLVDIDPQNTHIPDGQAADPAVECARYNAVIRELGGVDLQLLGLGHNGHIGFNEPGPAFVPGTHLVDLAERTIQANQRFFSPGEDVPRQALTMGIGNILQARAILVVVSGADKAEAVRRAFQGPVTPEVPASILQLHPEVTLVGDQAALSALEPA